MGESFQTHRITGMAVDPIHVGTGGGRLGRVDQSIVQDPVTQVPKISGSSLAGVYRAYAAMAEGKYPDCAGQGQPDKTGQGGHCGRPDCPICIVFGFARDAGGGFAGLAAFSDAQVLLFPVASREGPMWVTCPDALRRVGHEIDGSLDNAVYQQEGGATQPLKPLNLGWLLLERKNVLPNGRQWRSLNYNIPDYIQQRVLIVSDKLFPHIVDSNLEVRTSVSINPETGAAEEGALFSYEALPRATVLVWDVVCKNPRHFKVGNDEVRAKIDSHDLKDPDTVFKVVKTAHPYLEALGIGGMGTRGMGRLRVLYANDQASGAGQAAGAESHTAGG